MSDDPDALTPWHRPMPAGIHDGLVVYDGLLAAIGATSGARVVGAGTVRFDLGTEDGLVFDLCTGDAAMVDSVNSGDFEYTLEKLPDDGHQHSGIVRRSADVSDDTVWGDPHALHEVRFYVVNGSTGRGDQMVRYPDGQSFPGRTVLETEEWTITLDLCDDLPAWDDRLSRAGFVLTHCGTLRRSRGGEFAWRQAEPVLDAVHDYLSFARGARVGTALPTGVAAGGAITFEAITNTFVERGCTHFGWWDIDHPEVLASAWPAFLELRSTPFGHEVLDRVLSTYIDSVAGPPARGLVTASIGLETLTWAVLVEREGWLTPEAFKSLKFKDALGLVLKWAGIGQDLPECDGFLDDLKQVTNSLNPPGPAAVTWVRNGVVHPHDRTAQRMRDEHRHQAWLLSLWYLELLTLRLLHFEGRYLNRLTNEVEHVPWA